MSVRLKIDADLSSFNAWGRNARAFLPQMDPEIHSAAKFVASEARRRAPKDEGILRDSAEVTSRGVASYDVVFTRFTRKSSPQYPHFDVALWTHEAFYTPSMGGGPFIGRRYLARAWENNRAKLTKQIKAKLSLILHPGIGPGTRR